MKKRVSEKTAEVSRRDFIKASAAVGVATMFSGTERIFAAGSDKIRVGVIGLGNRGSGAASDCVHSSPNVEIVAVADLFRDHVNASMKKLKLGSKWTKKVPPETLKVTDDTCFLGFDAYKKVLACDVDMVILATPPYFRPEHLRAAIEAGKHVFMEKPAAVDPVGVRLLLAASEAAKKKKLSIVAGTQRRHQAHYLELIKRIHDGAIGEIVAGQCYWNQGRGAAHYKQPPGWSDMEWHLRNWNYITWLCGDFIVEQHVHSIDVMNWALNSHPVKVLGMGGREWGNIYDHFAVEFEYPNGPRVLSMCRQMEGCSDRISERVVGTKGSTYTDQAIGFIEGQNAFKYDGPSPDPYIQEHADLIASIRNGEPLNEGRDVAESTMAAIMGRMSAYTGRELKWDWAMKASKLDLSPPKLEFGDLPLRPVAVPGKTKLI